MSARKLKNGSIRFRGITNEAVYSEVTSTADIVGCSVTATDNQTVVTISGTASEMEAFEDLYFN